MKMKRMAAVLLLVLLCGCGAVAPVEEVCPVSREPELPQPPAGYVALTFDDGPSRHTERLLDGLAERGVQATFFLLGSRLEGSEALVQRMKGEGHQIGNHLLLLVILAGNQQNDDHLAAVGYHDGAMAVVQNVEMLAGEQADFGEGQGTLAGDAGYFAVSQNRHIGPAALGDFGAHGGDGIQVRILRGQEGIKSGFQLAVAGVNDGHSLHVDLNSNEDHFGGTEHHISFDVTLFDGNDLVQSWDFMAQDDADVLQHTLEAPLNIPSKSFILPSLAKSCQAAKSSGTSALRTKV